MPDENAFQGYSGLIRDLPARQAGFCAAGTVQLSVFLVANSPAVQVLPASLLTLIPDWGFTRPSKNDVA